jgi:hypothetical protein
MTEGIDDRDHELDDYSEPENVHPGALADSLCRLHLLGDDVYLRMQATNVGMVDVFLMRIETQLRSTLADDGGPDMELGFLLSAMSQMWIFAVYELLRTWRERATTTLKLLKENKLSQRIEALDTDEGFEHVTRKMLAAQMQEVLDNPARAGAIKEHLRRTYIPYARLDALRVTLAKHEVKGERGSVAYAPGYGRFNQWCGAIEYMIGRGNVINDRINRRDIADAFRSLWEGEAPTDDEIASFKEFMKGPPKLPPEAFD